MSSLRKRKALDQLSPYSRNDDNQQTDTNFENSSSQPINQKRRARANIGRLRGSTTDTESLKGVLSAVKILSIPPSNDKMSGLNKCFLNAISKVYNKQSDKDLRYLFAQYEKYLKEIEQNGSD